ncbi:MAG: asparaginase [Atribacterota bacterium]
MSKPLIKIFRGKLIENIYRGDIAVVNQNGNLLYSIGNPQKVTYWRSAAKPIQVFPVIYSGASRKYRFTEEEIAILASSHNGEEKHIKLVYDVLKKIKIDEKYLQCGICPPVYKPKTNALRKAKIKLSPVYNPCSGKHTAMLTLCQFFGWSIKDYYRIDHPVQQMILEDISSMCQYPKEKIYIGVDDCGVPVFGLPIEYMSNAYARIANWEILNKKYKKIAKKVFLSMVRNPYIIGGTDRFDTDLMKVANGNLLAKSGADGVFCIGIRKEGTHLGMGITTKIESGNIKFLPMAVIQVLKQLKILSETQLNKLNKYIPEGINNLRCEKVGHFVSDFELKEYKEK